MRCHDIKVSSSLSVNVNLRRDRRRSWALRTDLLKDRRKVARGRYLVVPPRRSLLKQLIGSATEIYTAIFSENFLEAPDQRFRDSGKVRQLSVVRFRFQRKNNTDRGSGLQEATFRRPFDASLSNGATASARLSEAGKF